MHSLLTKVWRPWVTYFSSRLVKTMKRVIHALREGEKPDEVVNEKEVTGGEKFFLTAKLDVMTVQLGKRHG